MEKKRSRQEPKGRRETKFLEWANEEPASSDSVICRRASCLPFFLTCQRGEAHRVPVACWWYCSLVWRTSLCGISCRSPNREHRKYRFAIPIFTSSRKRTLCSNATTSSNCYQQLSVFHNPPRHIRSRSSPSRPRSMPRRAPAHGRLVRRDPAHLGAVRLVLV